MSPEHTDIEWVAAQLPDPITPSDAVTGQARAALMEHIGQAAPAHAPRRERRHSAALRGRRVHRRPISLGLAAVAAAAGAFAIANVATDGGHGAVGSAQAATILAHAAQGGTPGPGQVLTASMTDGQGDVNAMAFDNRTPQDWVQTLTSAGGQPSQNGQQDGMREFFDPTTNTIYRDSDTSRAVDTSAGDQAFLEELNAPGDQTTVDHDATLNGQPVTTVTSRTTTGIVYELWVKQGSDLPVQFTETPASGAAQTTTFGYQTVTPSQSTPSPALLTALHPSATVTTLGDTAYQALLSKTQPAPTGNS